MVSADYDVQLAFWKCSEVFFFDFNVIMKGRSL